MALILNKQKVSAYDLPVKESVEPAPVEVKPKPKEKIDSLRDIRKKKKLEPKPEPTVEVKPKPKEKIDSLKDIRKKKKTEPKPEPTVEEKVEPEVVFDPSKTYLVVGGKAKEISSKSKYLLDMLVIEE